MVFPNAQHHVRFGNLLCQLLPVALRQAAGDHNTAQASPALLLGKFQDGVDALLLGVLNKAAGVDNHHLALGRVGAQLVFPAPQQGQQPLPVHLVFAASQGYHPHLYHKLPPFNITAWPIASISRTP